MISNWTSSTDGTQDNNDFGSGYPSDPKCKEWMDKIHDPLFGYCDLVRFSWNPTKLKLNGDDDNEKDERKDVERPYKVVFEADMDDEDEMITNPNGGGGGWKQVQQQKAGMQAFLKSGTTTSGTKRKKRLEYFSKRKLRVVSSIC